MAAYPDSIKSFTTKNTGETIAASHVNDLQDEVVAIEGGLRQGTAPLASSNSTMVALSVSGGSTLASLVVSGGSTLNTLQVTASTVTNLQAGGSTFSGSINVLGGNSTFAVRPSLPPPDLAVVYLENAKDVGSSALSTVLWTQQDIAINSSIHSTGTNPQQLVPQSTGVWMLDVQLQCGVGDPSELRELAVKDSSGSTLVLSRLQSTATVAALKDLRVTAYKRFDAVGGHFVVQFKSAGTSTSSLSSGVAFSRACLLKL